MAIIRMLDAKQPAGSVRTVALKALELGAESSIEYAMATFLSNEDEAIRQFKMAGFAEFDDRPRQFIEWWPHWWFDIILCQWTCWPPCFHFPGLERLLEGKPALLIEEGRILTKNLRREVMTRAELERAIRKHDLDPATDLPFIKKALLERDGVGLSEETIRGWLIEAGDWQRVRKTRRHRQWRERRGHPGGVGADGW
jgi:hypothetical protein